jgi:hypothetical protein
MSRGGMVMTNLENRIMTTNMGDCDSTETEKIAGIKQEIVDSEIERSRALLSTLESTLCGQGSSPWLFGFNGPTALDAHVVVFINRLRNVGRANLISSTLAKYADVAMDTPGWRQLMDGGRAV